MINLDDIDLNDNASETDSRAFGNDSPYDYGGWDPVVTSDTGINGPILQEQQTVEATSACAKSTLPQEEKAQVLGYKKMECKFMASRLTNYFFVNLDPL